MSSPFLISTVSETTSTVSINPVRSVLMSLMLIARGELDAAREPWLAATAAKFSAEERIQLADMLDEAGEALLPAYPHEQFEAYLNLLEGVSEGTVAELRSLWKRYFEATWKRESTMLRVKVDALNLREWPTDSAAAVIRAFLRRGVPDDIMVQLNGVDHVVFVPSPFIELAATRFGNPHTLWVFLGTDPRRHLPLRMEPTKRGEILRPASALGDEMRLRILELLAANGEMKAQELIALLDVSQSTVSRHLKQLRNAGFITEQRAGDANKVYCLDRSRPASFCFKLSSLLSQENALEILNDVRQHYKSPLRDYMGSSGRIFQWPSKRKAQMVVLEYLSTKVEVGRDYSEKEFNELLNEWHGFKDPAYLRRELVDFKFVERTPDGMRYWKEAKNDS